MTSAIWGAKCLQFYIYLLNIYEGQILNISSTVTSHKKALQTEYVHSNCNGMTSTLEQEKQMTHLSKITVTTGLLISPKNMRNYVPVR